MKRLIRSGLLVLAVVPVALTSVQPASADALLPQCAPSGPTEQVFAPWLDGARYFAAHNGGFEQGPADWTVTGAATVVNENESFKVGDAADSSGLQLKAGSSATSTAVCVGVEHPTVRLFVKAPATLGSALLIEATVRNPDTGLAVTVPHVVVGGVNANRWAPTSPLLVTSALGTVLDAELTVKISPIGVPATWRIDDVYVDPFKSR